MLEAPFAAQAVLEGPRVRLVQLTEAVLDDYAAALDDPELQRLTGSRAPVERAALRAWLRSRREHADRADWAVLRRSDNVFLGEAVLNELSPEDASCNFRIWLSGAHVGQGYGTEATRLVVEHALRDVGLHRVSLSVYAFNERARRSYERCGFVLEGRLRDALRWEGRWHDELVMAALEGDLPPQRG
ncbi:GNAT family N-acetyltransferase [Vallicoccus soli]|uniref:N-acetyltransferase n=1 Tax=Vallicoccus soli TaxID=2339232 RepID=A0A3A3ZIK2_9ACTN|nr:GNAT family protein [Vallicoccus soli]RJK95346.1 N-acetyltransferase [Vallicoccus soli]